MYNIIKHNNLWSISDPMATLIAYLHQNKLTGKHLFYDRKYLVRHLHNT